MMIIGGVLWRFTSGQTKTGLYEVTARLWPDIIHVSGSLSVVLMRTDFQCDNIWIQGRCRL